MADSVTTSLSVNDLVELVASGQLALPNFQRDFVWTDFDVKRLLATIVRGWPAGGLTFAERSEAAELAVRPLMGQPTAGDEIVSHIVLDGQQRVTALWEVFSGKGDRVWLIDPRALAPAATPEELEDGIVAVPREGPVQHMTDEWFPFSALLSTEAFLDWRNDRVSSNADAVRLTDEFLDQLTGVRDYRFPVTILGKHLLEDELTEVFQRINASGVPLSAFDLLVAKFHTGNWNLRLEWERARAYFPQVDVFCGNDGMLPIDVIALRLKGFMGRELLHGVSPEEVRDAFPAAIRGIDQSIDFLREACGVTAPSFLPHRGMLLILAALAGDVNLTESRELLRRWFFVRAFDQRFTSNASRRVIQDFQALRAGGRLPDFQATPLSVEELVLADRKRNTSRYRGFLCLMGARRRMYMGTNFESSNLIAQSIFPADFYPIEHERILSFVITTPRRAAAVALEKPSSIFREILPIAGLADAYMLPHVDLVNDVEPEPLLDKRARLVIRALGEL